MLAFEAGAAVDFTAGSDSVTEGGSVSVPIAVANFGNVTSIQFTMNWDSSVLQFASVGSFGLPSMSGSDFGTESSSSGIMTVSWDSTPSTLTDGSTLFAINFTAVGAAGATSPLSFGSVPLPQEIGVNYGLADASYTSGLITVVPEPVNVALVMFGMVIGVGTLTRRFRS